MEGLEDKADVLRPKFSAPVLCQAEHVDPIENDPAPARLIESCEQAKQCRLPATRRPHYRNKRLCLDLEI